MVLANNLILTNNVEGNGVLLKGKLSFFFGFPIDFNYGGRGRAATWTGIKLSTRLAEGRDGKHRGTMKIGTRTSKENTSILFRLSSCRATVLVKQVTRDRTVHSRLHPRFDQFRSDLSPPPPPPYQPFWTYYATIITIHKRERHYFILVWKFSWTSKPRVGLKHVVPPLSVHFPSIMYIRRWLTRSRIVRDKILDSNEGGDWKRLKTIWHVVRREYEFKVGE